MKLDIGCGETKKEGFTGVDKRPEAKPDILCELGVDPLPLDENTVDYIWAHHSLEHFDNLVEAVNELGRVSKHRAVWDIWVPYCTSTLNLVNPYHKHYFNEFTFRFWDDIYKREQPKYFKLEQEFVDFEYNQELWGGHTSEEWEDMRQKYFNIVNQMHVKLVVIKKYASTK